MSEQLLNVLKLCLLALVYLFFFRVLRAVWAELNPPKPSRAERRRARGPAPVAAAAVAAAPAAVPAAGRPAKGGGRPAKAKRGAAPVVGRLVVLEPADQKGRAYPLGEELTLGRAPGCGIQVVDTFVSQLHARVYRSDGNYVVEDLGSTNGTFCNSRKVAGPVVLQRGDRLQVGNTVLELE